jgi:hypothetical protein
MWLFISLSGFPDGMGTLSMDISYGIFFVKFDVFGSDRVFDHHG